MIYKNKISEKTLKYCKNICKSTISDNKIQLPLFDSKNEFLKDANEIYDYKQNNDFVEKKLIIMDYPMERIKEYNGFDLVDYLSNFSNENLLLRYHPCSVKNNDLDVAVDTINNSWELECIYSLSENKILVSFFSTSLLLPKMLTNKEPTLIFTYKIMSNDLSDIKYKNYELLIDMIRSCYIDKNKIYVPSTVNEMNDILNKLIKHSEER